MHEEFLARTPWQWLSHYPRYLSGICYRLEKLRSGAGARDDAATETVAALWSRYLDRFAEAEQSPGRRAGDEFRWMIEELRVSLYAQPLGTAVKVSPTRCEKWLSQN